MSILTSTHSKQKIWVVFTGQSDIPWLKMLRRGFRHCLVLINDGHSWTSLDPMLNHIEIRNHYDIPADFDFPAWLRSRGETVIPATPNYTNTKPAPWSLFSCVEAVKRTLGIHKFFIFTPWQLYRHLIQTNNIKEINHG